MLVEGAPGVIQGALLLILMAHQPAPQVDLSQAFGNPPVAAIAVLDGLFDILSQIFAVQHSINRHLSALQFTAHRQIGNFQLME
jgi:hypothetical protein